MDNEVLHQKFVEYGGDIKKLMRECALMLPEIDRQKIWKSKGFGSIYEYAAKLANMSRYQVELALWTVRKIEHLPLLMKVAQEKGIHAVRPVANVANKNTDAFWAEKASLMTKTGLETYVREVKKSCPGTRREIKFSLPIALARRWDCVSKRADFSKLIEKFLNDVEIEEELQKPDVIKTDSRHVPVKIQRYIKDRTDNKCAYPGCFKSMHQLHHTQRWALEKVHDPGRLQPLCQAHNELAHLSLIENEDQSPETWYLRATPDVTHPKYAVDQQVMTYSRRGG